MNTTTVRITLSLFRAFGLGLALALGWHLGRSLFVGDSINLADLPEEIGKKVEEVVERAQRRETYDGDGGFGSPPEAASA